MLKLSTISVNSTSQRYNPKNLRAFEGKATAGNAANSRHICSPAGQSVCQERCKTAGKNTARVAEQLPVKVKQPAKSFAGSILEGRLNSREKTFAGS
jgi:hypothetical protein